MKKHLLDKRKLSYLINDWDDLNLPFTINDNDIASQVVDFFYKQSELDAIKGTIVTTEKDAVKMSNFNRKNIYAMKLKIDLDIKTLLED